MLFSCYLRNSVVYVPTVGKRGGAYTDIEPVAVVPVANADGLRRALLEVIGRGNVALPPLKEVGPHERPSFARSASFGGFESAEAWSA
jgi:hypothetical protein